MIKVPELAVSKSHAVIGYDRSEHCFTVTDVGSVNGTLLNQDRLSEVRGLHVGGCVPYAWCTQ